ncbi:MAG: DUF2520 domain-containing protein [Planctomycetes bacterium]|nr:DUF2520 domain-containing protein [Planctomycetota bacterium]
MSLAVIGPGRVGVAFARRLREAGVAIDGFVGRDPGRTRLAAESIGAHVLAIEDLVRSPIVLVAVGDQELERVAEDAAAAGAVAAGSVWWHPSGFHGPDALRAVRKHAAHVGVVHPLCPIPDADRGYESLAGALATVAGDREAFPILEAVAMQAGLLPVAMRAEADRVRYHAACALAANGVTAAIGLAIDLLEDAVEPADARRVAASLAARAAHLVFEHGAEVALSGPAVRGDADVLAAHTRALRSTDAADAYRELMRRAVAIAQRRGSIDAAMATRLDQALETDG